MRRAAFLVVLVLALAGFTASGVSAKGDITPELAALVKPPTAPIDVLGDMNDQFDYAPAGLCADFSTVGDPSGATATGMWMIFQLAYYGPWRNNVVRLAAINMQALHQHLAIWLFHYNGSAWVYANQAKFRWPDYTGSTGSYFRSPAGDTSNPKLPRFFVRSNTGYYAIKVAVINQFGQAVDQAFVGEYAHTDGVNYPGNTRYCLS